MRADPGKQSALGLVQVDLAGVCRVLMNVAVGARGKALINDLQTTAGGTPSQIVWQALYADCLRVVHSAVMADGVIEDREIEALHEIIAAAAHYYAIGLRSQYGEFAVVDRESARAFLDRYAADRGPFGYGARLRWPGLTLCRRAAELGERGALQRYSKAMGSMSAEARRLSGNAVGETRRSGPGDEIDELGRILASEVIAMTQEVDRRAQAFLAPCRVFSAVQGAASIYENDPFDVEAVHHEARASFEQLVVNATNPQITDQGRMLVVLGDSGAGKTHVLRGFRRHVQEGNRGFVVYAQLQSRSEDYSRYLLVHLIDSLSRRYSEVSGTTGLRELAGGLLRISGPRLRERIERFADDSWEANGSLADYVNELVDDLLHIGELGSFDPDLLRVLCYALRPDPRATSSVYKYLRCDAMNEHDRRWIGNVEPRTRDDDPHWMILQLARFAAVTRRALVIMVDQVDLAGFEADSTRIFRRAIDALYWIVSECSSAIAVVACLSDLYSAARAELNRPAIDRLENAPPIARLQVNRSYPEIEAVVARRLSYLFAEHGTVHRPEQPVYPIPERELRQLENRRLRDVLEWCHQFQTQCAAAGKIINTGEPITVEIKSRERDLDAIAAAWSEATQAKDLQVPDEEEEILTVVAEAAKAYVQEMGLALAAPLHKNGVLRLRMSRGEDCAALVVAVTNSNPQGGAFTGHIDWLRRRARGMVPIAVRTLEFPRGRACDRAMGQLINIGGRGAYLDASTLRALVAFQRFQPPFAADRISAWQLRDRPISSLPAVVEIFDFERSRVEDPGSRRRVSSISDEMNDASETPSSMSVHNSMERSTSRQVPVSTAQLWVGNSTGLQSEPITLELTALLRHIAIVDGAGNGRAAALHLVEQALEHGVPAIMLDRTGEMSGYARPDWWQRSADAARARRLAERIDVRLFTPGIRGGRPLSVAIIPELSTVPEDDRDRAVRRAAEAVAAMIPAARGDTAKRCALLTDAIARLARGSSQSGLVELISLLEAGPEELAGTDGDEHVRQGVVEDLAALLGNADVFTFGAEPLTAATLVGSGTSGQVPLAIINTSFFGDGPRLQTWVCQLIECVANQIAARSCNALQAVLVVDGADDFLPAGSSKALSKEPLLELLKTAGAAGVGVVLVSQQPAELDYRRCTAIDTWFIGKTDVSPIDKMKTLFKYRPLGHRDLSRLEPGRLVMLREDDARDVERASPAVLLEPIGAAELKALAARLCSRGRDSTPPRRPESAVDVPEPTQHLPR